MQTPRRWPLGACAQAPWLVSLLGVPWLAACGGPAATQHTIETVRTVDAANASVRFGATPAERFGFAMPGTTPGASHSVAPLGMGSGNSVPGASPSVAAPLTWTRPADWSELAPTSMRIANFAIGGGAGECYVTVFPGDGGGELANVNRWRGQLGLAPWRADDLAKCAPIEILGRQRPWIDLAADSTTDSDPQAMLAVVCPVGDRTVFVKFIGQRSAVDAEREHFREFCASLEAHPMPVGP